MDTKALRQKILDLAIRGKLVPQDPNDEPASVLLERIREQKQQMVKEGKLKKKDIKNDSVIFIGEDNLYYEKFADGTVKCIENEIPFEVPEGWNWCRYSDVIELYSGQDLTPDRYNDVGEGIPYITGASNLVCGKVLINRWTSTPTTHATKNDLLLTVKGSGVGKMAFCDITDAHIARQIMALRCTKVIKPQYLYIVISAMLSDIITQANGIIPGIRREIVLGTLLPLPPFSEQEKICEKAESSLRIINLIENEKDDLKECINKAKSKILDLAICGQLVPQNPDDEPASVLLERIRAEKEELIKQGKIKRDKKESIIFKGEDNSYYETIGKNNICIDEKIPFNLPEGWAWTRIRNTTQFIRNGASIKQYKDASGFPITRIETISTGKVDRNRFGYADIFELDKYESYVMKDYDILMSHINSPKHLGKCALYRQADNEVIIHGMNLLAIRPVLCGLAEYLCIVFRSNYFKDFIWENMKQAVNQASITTTLISEFLLPIPPYEELKQIIKIYNRISNIIDKISEKLS